MTKILCDNYLDIHRSYALKFAFEIAPQRSINSFVTASCAANGKAMGYRA